VLSQAWMTQSYESEYFWGVEAKPPNSRLWSELEDRMKKIYLTLLLFYVPLFAYTESIRLAIGNFSFSLSPKILLYDVAQLRYQSIDFDAHIAWITLESTVLTQSLKIEAPLSLPVGSMSVQIGYGFIAIAYGNNKFVAGG
jgi:hypothetical protein